MTPSESASGSGEFSMGDMTDSVADLIDHELPAAGDESGTAPGDRRFRPDVEGLRAVAILLVVLYHASG